MKQFLIQGTGFSRLSPANRFVYSLFLIFCLGSYGVMVVMATDRAGWLPHSIAQYYAGNEELGQYPKTYGELIEVTHFHLFSIPVFLLIHSHIFMMCRLPLWLRGGVVVVAFAGGFFYIIGPWLVRFVAVANAPLLVLGRFSLMVALVIMTLWPLAEILRSRALPKNHV